MKLAILLALAVSLTAAAGAVAFDRYKVRGPKTVHVGDEVRFPTKGLKPRQKITVNLAPTANRGGNCCGVDVIRGARADASGEAILHFKWPKTYLNGDDKVRWRHNSKVDVIVLGENGRGLKVVRVKTR
jgi:hypothetical protein